VQGFAQKCGITYTALLLFPFSLAIAMPKASARQPPNITTNQQLDKKQQTPASSPPAQTPGSSAARRNDQEGHEKP
jgi:hypothetical protein